MRLRALRILDPGIGRKKRLTQSLIMPAFTWAAGVARPSQQELKELKDGILWMLRTSVTREAPWVVLCAAHGWDWDPHFALEWASLRTACRCHCRPPAWLDEVPLAEGVMPWTIFVPHASDALRKCGWGLTLRESTIKRRDDDNGLRFFRIGYDSRSVLRNWLIEHFKLQAVHQCPRIAKSFHRPNPDLARGLALPAPQPGTRYALAGHRTLGVDTPVSLRRAAQASGGSCWHVAKRVPGYQHPLRCVCGLEAPSRAHLAWNCDALTPIQAIAELPRARAGERLFAAEIPDFPPATGEREWQMAADQLASHLETLAHGDILIATDGSSKHHVGASAVAVEGFSFTTFDSHEDQTPFICELKALRTLAGALARVTKPVTGSACILTDCQGALQAIANPLNCQLPLLARDIARDFDAARAKGWRLSLAWIPSHGKIPNWQPPHSWSYSAQACRNLNVIADKAAEEAREAHAALCRRPQWCLHWSTAKAWEERAISRSAKAADALEAFYRQTAATDP